MGRRGASPPLLSTNLTSNVKLKAKSGNLKIVHELASSFIKPCIHHLTYISEHTRIHFRPLFNVLQKHSVSTHVEHVVLFFPSVLAKVHRSHDQPVSPTDGCKTHMKLEDCLGHSYDRAEF